VGGLREVIFKEHFTSTHRLLSAAISLWLAVVMLALPAAAQKSYTTQMRTYVSGQGSDSNPCTALSPCRTFKAALALTSAGGEVFVLNSADYGAATINKAVTLSSDGAMAGVLASGGGGLTISAGATDVINVRGLDIDGANSGTTGIEFSSGAGLNVLKSSIRGFTTYGIAFAAFGGRLFAGL
jgi:hypothetical protein